MVSASRCPGSSERRGSLRRGDPLQEEWGINLGLIRDLYALLAVIDEEMPEGAVLYLEGTSIDPEIGAFLEAHRAQESHPVVRGTLWPQPRSYHLPLSSSNLSQLRELAERHAEREICDHLVVYRGDQVLLSGMTRGVVTFMSPEISLRKR